ncbi:MAG: hypothetical protein L0Y56_10715, partial [Nitrospira sp.]|nr:hypothetical protein [Nitrospira sp.]
AVGNGKEPTNAGARYNPSTDTWVSITTVGAPTARRQHTAIWTGSQMIVWGGSDETNEVAPPLNTGAVYLPSLDKWTALPTAPIERRKGHTVVWTGSEMIIWGGFGCTTLDCTTQGYFQDGAFYNPGTLQWRYLPPNIQNNPTERANHTAVWTGSEMIVWGGKTDSGLGLVPLGARYVYADGSWHSLSEQDSPGGVRDHTAIWTGSEMIIWGGGGIGGDHLNKGARYLPGRDLWTPVGQIFEPSDGGRSKHTAVWTGSEMIIWGGEIEGSAGPVNTGWRYVLGLDNGSDNPWFPTGNLIIPDGRYSHTSIWTGSEMIIWGGLGVVSGSPLDSGGRYDPVVDIWSEISVINAPTSRARHTAVWTGSEMIIWGGHDSSERAYDDGGRYDPVGDSWIQILEGSPSAPTPRFYHTAVWTGEEMIIWGGKDNPPNAHTNTGGRYDPVTDTWISTSTDIAPSQRALHTAIWTGGEMIIWGGNNIDGNQRDGGRYNPTSDTWNPVSLVDAPTV